MKIDIKEGYIRYVLIVGVIMVLVIVGYLVKNVFMVVPDEKNKIIGAKDNLEVLYDAKESKNTQGKTEEVPAANNKTSNIKVEIKGAVTNPGVYIVCAEDRVEDLIKLSGGFLPNTDKLRIRLADRLVDEEVIYVYSVGEKTNLELLELGINNHSTIDKGNSGQSNKNGKININTATKEQLMTLAGIGEVKANGIIAYREEHNGFKAVDELKNVPGIGEKTLGKFAQLVDIN